MYPTIEQMPMSTKVFLANLNVDIDYKFNLLLGAIRHKFLMSSSALGRTIILDYYNTDKAFKGIKEQAGIL
jgi:hypothetical protein